MIRIIKINYEFNKKTNISHIFKIFIYTDSAPCWLQVCSITLNQT